MSRLEAWLHRLAHVLVGGTGLVYAFLRYAVRPADPYAVVNHPLQPLAQHLHVLAAPVLVFSAGALWHRHVLERLRDPASPRRRSGVALLLALAPMTASGYLIQVAVEETWRQVWVVVHVAAAALWLVAFGLHQIGPRSEGCAGAARRLELAPPQAAAARPEGSAGPRRHGG